MKIAKTLLGSFNSYFTLMGRARARTVLLQNSDRMLEDAGLSRELLESGIKAWPWRASEQELPALVLEKVEQPAVKHESTLDGDYELHDSGITAGPLAESREPAAKVIDHSNERKVA